MVAISSLVLAGGVMVPAAQAAMVPDASVKAWASTQGLVTNGDFTSTLSRSTGSVILWRYAGLFSKQIWRGPQKTDCFTDSAFKALDEGTRRDICWLADRGVAAGAGGAFNPSSALTRGAFATFLARYVDGVMGQPAVASCASTDKPFDDVPSSNTHCRGIKWFKATGLASMFTSTKLFSPDAAVTRGEAIEVLYRLAHVQASTYNVRKADHPSDQTTAAKLWANRVPNVVNEIVAAHPDVIGIQEAINKSHAGAIQFQDLLTKLNARGVTYADAGLVSGDGMAHILYNTATITKAPTPNASATNLTTYGCPETGRALLQIDLVDRFTGRSFTFATTHLCADQRSGTSSVKYQEAVAIGGALRNTLPTILVGDFNHDPTLGAYDPYSYLTTGSIAKGKLSDAVRVSTSGASNTRPPTWNNWGTGQSSYDSIFLRAAGSRSIRVDSWFNKAPKYVTTNLASDHCLLSAGIWVA